MHRLVGGQQAIMIIVAFPVPQCTNIWFNPHKWRKVDPVWNAHVFQTLFVKMRSCSTYQTCKSKCNQDHALYMSTAGAVWSATSETIYPRWPVFATAGVLQAEEQNELSLVKRKGVLFLHVAWVVRHTILQFRSETIWNSPYYPHIETDYHVFHLATTNFGRNPCQMREIFGMHSSPWLRLRHLILPRKHCVAAGTFTESFGRQ